MCFGHPFLRIDGDELLETLGADVEAVKVNRITHRDVPDGRGARAAGAFHPLEESIGERGCSRRNRAVKLDGSVLLFSLPSEGEAVIQKMRKMFLRL